MHDAQLEALAYQKRCTSLPNDGVSDPTAILGDIHMKMSTINDSLMVLFASLQSLATVIPPGDARTALQTLTDMGT